MRLQNTLAVAAHLAGGDKTRRPGSAATISQRKKPQY